MGANALVATFFGAVEGGMMARRVMTVWKDYEEKWRPRRNLW